MDDEIRAITPADLPAVASLLSEGFSQPKEYWTGALAKLSGRPVPPELQPFGYLLDVDGQVQGAILTFSSYHLDRGVMASTSNVSSWYVHSAFRGERARRLYRRATDQPNVFHYNLSPADNTIRTVEAAGFSELTSGQLAALARFSVGRRRTASLKLYRAGQHADLADADEQILSDHDELGCLSMVLETSEGVEPMIFLRRRIKGRIPCAQLLLCRDGGVLTEHMDAISRGLWAQGQGFLLIDCNGPLNGVFGRFSAGKRRRFVKGGSPSSFLDFSYSELAFLPGVS